MRPGDALHPREVIVGTEICALCATRFVFALTSGMVW